MQISRGGWKADARRPRLQAATEVIHRVDEPRDGCGVHAYHTMIRERVQQQIHGVRDGCAFDGARAWLRDAGHPSVERIGRHAHGSGLILILCKAHRPFEVSIIISSSPSLTLPDGCTPGSRALPCNRLELWCHQYCARRNRTVNSRSLQQSESRGCGVGRGMRGWDWHHNRDSWL